jgi:hypothetical protein
LDAAVGAWMQGVVTLPAGRGRPAGGDGRWLGVRSVTAGDGSHGIAPPGAVAVAGEGAMPVQA